MPSVPVGYASHTLVTFGGKLGSSSEIWSNSIRVGAVGGAHLTLTDPATYLAEIAPPLATWFGGTDFLNIDTLTFVKANNIGADGEYEDPAHPHTHDYPGAGIPGGYATSDYLPRFLSLCLSWRGDALRGPGSNGRIFPPWRLQSGDLVGAGHEYIADGTIAGFMTKGLALLTILRNAGGTEQAVPVIASQVTGTNYPITSIRIGNVLDSQRRRKNALVETYLQHVTP